MSKKSEPRPFVGAIVQLVSGNGAVIQAAIVTRVHDAAAGVVNLKVFLDGRTPSEFEANVQSESEARKVNASRVGFPVSRFWRWPRA